jgi:hypothetical protein
MLSKSLRIRLSGRLTWVGEGETLQFRDDIYGHDRRLAAALPREVAPERGNRDAENLSVKASLGLL